MIFATDFGQFISEQKRKHSLQSTELAEMLNISKGYLRMIKTFDLNEEEQILIFDLYEKASGKLSPDIIEYVQANKVVKMALRAAKSANATDNDWEMFIERIRK